MATNKKYSPSGQSLEVMNELADSSTRAAEPRGIQPIVRLRSDAVQTRKFARAPR